MPRAQLTTDELETMRQRLSDAALEIYLNEGVDAVTFRRLADAVGLSHTLPYRYFENKDALLARLRRDCVQRFEIFVRAREASSAAPLARVRSVAEAYVDFVRQYPDEYLLMFSTQQPPPSRYPELLAARRSLFEHAVEVVQQCIDAGELAGQAREVAHLIWVGLHGLMTLHVANQLVHGCGLENLVQPLMDRMLGGSAAAAKRVPKFLPGPAMNRAGSKPRSRR